MSTSFSMADFEDCRRELREDSQSFVTDEDVVNALTFEQLDGLVVCLRRPENRLLHKDLLTVVINKIESVPLVHG